MMGHGEVEPGPAKKLGIAVLVRVVPYFEGLVVLPRSVAGHAENTEGISPHQRSPSQPPFAPAARAVRDRPRLPGTACRPGRRIDRQTDDRPGRSACAANHWPSNSDSAAMQRGHAVIVASVESSIGGPPRWARVARVCCHVETSSGRIRLLSTRVRPVITRVQSTIRSRSLSRVVPLSHSRAVLSPLPVSTRVPSGLKAMASTGPWCVRGSPRGRR